MRLRAVLDIYMHYMISPLEQTDHMGSSFHSEDERGKKTCPTSQSFK